MVSHIANLINRKIVRSPKIVIMLSMIRYTPKLVLSRCGARHLHITRPSLSIASYHQAKVLCTPTNPLISRSQDLWSNKVPIISAYPTNIQIRGVKTKQCAAKRFFRSGKGGAGLKRRHAGINKCTYLLNIKRHLMKHISMTEDICDRLTG